MIGEKVHHQQNQITLFVSQNEFEFYDHGCFIFGFVNLQVESRFDKIHRGA